MHFRVLEEIAGFHACMKFGSRKKAIIFAVDLTAARRAGGAGNGVNEVRAVWRSASTQRCLARADGAETTKRIPLRPNCLFKVLNLLANFFQLGFAGDNVLRNRRIVCFCPEGIQFAKDFLSDELQSAPDRLVPTQMMGELGKVTFQARQFLGNIGAIGEESKLL